MICFKSDNVISSLGVTTVENYNNILNGNIGIRQHHIEDIYHEPFIASMVDSSRCEKMFTELAIEFDKEPGSYTKLEKLMILSIHDALSKVDVDVSSIRTGFVVSTTKGNIDLLSVNHRDKFEDNRVKLWKLGEIISGFFSNPNTPIVISNACVSGVMAINKAAMLIDAGVYDNVIVAGGDIVSRFVVSGFMSFMSLSETPCKPFDGARSGLSLGEAASTIIMGNCYVDDSLQYIGGGSANDANHISGPSRTGEGSFIAIRKALTEAGINPEQIDHISAHGTATPYNDEMESIAIDRHGMNAAAVNSMKGYLGHTLGAAGVVETAILLEEMRRGIVLATAGYEKHGVSRKINVIRESGKIKMDICLKMSSGFGGSNATLLIKNAGFNE